MNIFHKATFLVIATAFAIIGIVCVALLKPTVQVQEHVVCSPDFPITHEVCNQIADASLKAECHAKWALDEQGIEDFYKHKNECDMQKILSIRN